MTLPCDTLSREGKETKLTDGQEQHGQAATDQDESTNYSGAEDNSERSSEDESLDYQSKHEEERVNNLRLRSELTAAQEKLDALERSKLTVEENQRRDIDKLKELQKEFDLFKKTTFLELAISQETKFQWHPNALADVRNSIDFDKVSFSDLKDGRMTVDGLDIELKRIAQEKPYLLKHKEKPKDSGRANDSASTGLASGAHPYGSSSKNKTADTDLLRKYKIA